MTQHCYVPTLTQAGVIILRLSRELTHRLPEFITIAIQLLEKDIKKAQNIDICHSFNHCISEWEEEKSLLDLLCIWTLILAMMN